MAGKAKSASIARRKDEHLSLVLSEEAVHSGSTLLECVRPVHCALPEMDMADIDTSVEFFGRRITLPLMISGMTGGTKEAGSVNRSLARVAARTGVPLGLGSQRIMLRNPETTESFRVRDEIGDGVLLGNIGGAELCEYDTDVIVGLVNSIEADGMAVHLNPAQEIIQPEGARVFTGVLEGIRRLVDRLEGRVVVKETGAGLSPWVVKNLARAGVMCVDVSGAGGTSFTRVEMLRGENPEHFGRALADWGIPTAAAVAGARKAGGDGMTVIGSGGITNGAEIATAIMLGASLVGIARAVYAALRTEGEDGAESFINRIADQLRAVMLLTASSDVPSLSKAQRVVTGELKDWLLQMEVV
jgi:isopentenyl-diphosphate delta-isomerase